MITPPTTSGPQFRNAGRRASRSAVVCGVYRGAAAHQPGDWVRFSDGTIYRVGHLVTLSHDRQEWQGVELHREQG